MFWRFFGRVISDRMDKLKQNGKLYFFFNIQLFFFL
jgi:hypothetical protein